MNDSRDKVLSALNNDLTTYKYHANTLSFIDELVDAGKKIIEASVGEKIKPVIMIDGPAGTGKSTFAKDLAARFREKGVNVCYLEQDNFGMDRWKRGVLQINSCADISRDPRTVEKMMELMQTATTKIPEYVFKEGIRIPDKKSINSGDLIIYEGVSALSSVVYDNYQFNPAIADKYGQVSNENKIDFTKYVPIRIFFRPDSDETMYVSRLKRDSEERGVDASEYDANWDNVTKNNWLYTMRGLANANIVVTRRNNNFIFTCLDTINFNGAKLKEASVSQDEAVSLKKLYIGERRDILKKNTKTWFGNHYVAMKRAAEYEDTCLANRKPKSDNHVNVHKNSGLQKPDDWRKKIIKQKLQIKNLYQEDINNTVGNNFIDDGSPDIKNSDLDFFYKCNGVGFFSKSLEEADVDALKKHPHLARRILQHDSRFNNKKKLAAENAMAAIVLDNAGYFIAPVQIVVDKLLGKLISVIDKYISGTANEAESKLIELMIVPFTHTKGMMELGRVTDENKPEPGNEEILELLLKMLSSKNNADASQKLFTLMRFIIQIGHVITHGINQLNDEDVIRIFGSDMVDRMRTFSQSVWSDEIFAPISRPVINEKIVDQERQVAKGRQVNYKLLNKKTQTFGTFEDIDDIPDEFKKFIGRRFLAPEKNYEKSLQSHTASKLYIRAIPVTKHNKTAFSDDIPMISSVSGSMNLIMSVAQTVGLSREELKVFNLAAIATIIGGGHHSLAECMAISQRVIHCKTTTYLDLMPDKIVALYGVYKTNQSAALLNAAYKQYPNIRLIFEFLDTVSKFSLNDLWIDEKNNQLKEKSRCSGSR